VLHQREVDVGYLEDIVVEIAFKDAKARSLGDNVCSSFEISFPCAVVTFETDKPGNVGLSSSQLRVGVYQPLYYKICCLLAACDPGNAQRECWPTSDFCDPCVDLGGDQLLSNGVPFDALGDSV